MHHLHDIWKMTQANTNDSNAAKQNRCCLAGARAVVQGLLGEALQPLAAAAARAAASSFDPDSPDDNASLPSDLQAPVAKLQSLLTGIAMTHAQALIHRAPGVGAFASQLKVITCCTCLS